MEPRLFVEYRPPPCCCAELPEKLQSASSTKVDAYMH
jgi:hypothetical protein